MMFGLFLFALGIVLAIRANIGYAPWEVFHVGISNRTGLSIGVVSILIGLLIVIIVTAMGEKLGLGTILNMLFIGMFIDLLFFINIIPLCVNPVTGTLMLITGLFTISIGTYFYTGSAFGAGPRDNLMVVLARRTKLPVGVCRFALELLVTFTGWLLGGMVGFGTVLSVVLIGFCVQITFKVLKYDITAIRHETLGDTFAILKKITARKTRS